MVKVHGTDIASLLGHAATELQHGRLKKAESLLRQILQANPDHADANHLLGVIAIQHGQYRHAIQLISLAIRLNPGAAMYHSNLAYALHADNRLAEALSACDAAIRIGPVFPEIFFNRGNILCALGRLQEAEASYEQAIRLRPDYADAHYKRANTLLSAGRINEAEAAYRRVVELNPAHAGAYNNLAVVLANSGRPADALVACDQAIRIRPEYAQAYTCRSDALRRMGRLSEAMRSCDRAIEMEPDYAEAHYNRGNVLLDSGLIEEAENSYRRAHELRPDDANLHSNILFVQAARACLPFDGMLEELRRWDVLHGQEGRKASLAGQDGGPVSGRRIRVGYVSPHMHSNVVAYFFEPLLAAHDKTRFEIYCYACMRESRADAVTHRMRSMADHWRFVFDMSDDELAKLIRRDGIDVLVDLAGHTSRNRLKVFTYRPAPVQATYLGFFAATGLEAMDYWITDEVIHPRDTLELSVEEKYRLPRCWVGYKPPDIAPPVAPCPTPGHAVVFGSFNNISKLNQGVIDTWSEILRRLPGSRLLLMASAISDDEVRKRYLRQFAANGIGEDRLMLREGASYGEYFATYAEVDIVLDAFPRTGGTTTAEALWMGVPVITLAGDRYVERISASKLIAIGMGEMVADSRQAYMDKALSLARDPQRRLELRATLRDTMARSPLCDGDGLARAIESAYADMLAKTLSRVPR